MLTFLTVIHVFVALFLIFFVLLQDSKGGAMGMLSGGGSSNTVFGSTGAVNILVKITRWTAVAFALTCIALTVIISGQTESSLLDKAEGVGAAPTAPVVPVEKVEKAPKKEDTAAPAPGDSKPKADK